MGRPPNKDRDLVKQKVVPPIRVTEEELDSLKAGAELAGKPLGKWLRDLGLREAKRLKAKQ